MALSGLPPLGSARTRRTRSAARSIPDPSQRAAARRRCNSPEPLVDPRSLDRLLRTLGAPQQGTATTGNGIHGPRRAQRSAAALGRDSDKPPDKLSSTSCQERSTWYLFPVTPIRQRRNARPPRAERHRDDLAPPPIARNERWQYTQKRSFFALRSVQRPFLSLRPPRRIPLSGD